ncbi:MAG: hypothetical protein IPK83_04415 [Planctomycetes bacterium]|nr:hypothetical protein [Planctomycetota bacterium]
MDDLISVEGMVSRNAALNEMVQTGVLLQIGAMDMDTHSMSTKIFEYIATRRPILALVPEGPIASIVRNLDAGWIISPDRPDEIARKVLELCQQHAREGLVMNAPVDLSRFTRRYQAGQLLELINRAVRQNA